MLQTSDQIAKCNVQGAKPSEVAGMTWWNGLSEADRRYWCLAAMTAVPAEAWQFFQLVTEQLVTAPREIERISENN